MNSRSIRIPWGKNDAQLRLVRGGMPPPAEEPSPRHGCMLEYYIFKATLLSKGGHALKNRPIRKIRIAGQKSLYGFARFIVESFGFVFDHCFGFHDNFERPRDSKRAYELFVDAGEEPLAPHSKGVKRTKIETAFRGPGDRMLFQFDYGDDWRFAVELLEITRAERWNLKPALLERIGRAPRQYPPEGER